MKTAHFEYRSRISGATTAAARAFHERPDALRLLTPPPIRVQVVEDTRRSLHEGEVKFKLWFGPLPIYWHARHEPGVNPDSFLDRMIVGPMARWEHQHIINAQPDGIELIDRIEYAHPQGWRGMLTRIFFGRLPLRLLFFYRHLRTKRALTGAAR